MNNDNPIFTGVQIVMGISAGVAVVYFLFALWFVLLNKFEVINLDSTKWSCAQLDASDNCVEYRKK